MKFAQSSIIALLAPAVAGRFSEVNEPDNVQLYPMGYYKASTEQYLIELEHGVTRWVTEDEKWELKRVSPPFRHVTDRLVYEVPRRNDHDAHAEFGV